MKVVLLAGGLGTRLIEETEPRPKPMVEIGGKPNLWHIMKIYETYGFDEFVIFLGYKSQLIKEYFLNYHLYNADITVELEKNKVDLHFNTYEAFKVMLVDTRLNTNTTGRIKKIKKYVENETFMLTYGVGVADINIKDFVAFHKSHGKYATLTCVQTPSRFGNIEIDSTGIIDHFVEKPQVDGMWINGGFIVLEPAIFNYLQGDVENVQWEN